MGGANDHVVFVYCTYPMFLRKGHEGRGWIIPVIGVAPLAA